MLIQGELVVNVWSYIRRRMKNIRSIVASPKLLLMERNYPVYSVLSDNGESELSDFCMWHSLCECVAQKVVPASHRLG